MKITSRKQDFITPLTLTALIASNLVAPAVDFNWDGSESSDWATGANWTSGNAPSGTDIRINIGNSAATTSPNRAIYTTAQGQLDVGGSGIRGLFIGNGSGTVGVLEITGGIINNIGSVTDGMANGGGSGTLILNGGEYRKITGTGGASTFSLNYGAGTSRLEINSGSFQAGTLNFQETDPGTTVTTTGTIQLNGGVLSIGSFSKSNTSSGSTHNVYLNGGTVASRADATWSDLTNVTWTLQSKSTFDIGHSVSFREVLGGTGGFDKTGVGNLGMTGENTYTGVTAVNAGIITAGNNSAFGATGAGNGTTVASGARVTLNDGITITGETLSITGDGGSGSYGALQAAANATATWDGAITATSTATRIGAQSGGNLILKGDLTASANDMIIRSVGNDTTTGAAFDNTVVTLAGTYTGSRLTIFQGVLKLGASERFQDTAVLNFGTSASTSIKQRFDLNGYNETLAGIIVTGSALSETHEVTNTSATLSTLTLNSTTNRDFSGIVTGNLAINKSGSNTLTFSGINTYTGNTSVNAGTFNVTTIGALNGGGSTTVASGATFTLLGTYLFNIGDNGINNSISGAGTLNLTGTLNLNLASAAIAAGNSWQIVDADGSISWTSMQLTSTAGNFTRNAGIWSLSEGGREWAFNENTGILELIAVPEPSQTLLLLVGLSGCALRRRRKV